MSQKVPHRMKQFTGSERERLWTKVVELYPFFADHQAKAARQIPVIVLKRQEGSA